MMDIGEIIKTIPHRYPFLLVDRVLDYVPGKSLRALKNVTINEPFFQGHFPEKAVMPGVLMLESLAQACSLLIMCNEKWRAVIDNGGLMLFIGIDNARFKRQVVPGDTLILDITLNRMKFQNDVYGIFDTSAFVGEQLAVSATLKLMCKSKVD